MIVNRDAVGGSHAASDKMPKTKAIMGVHWGGYPLDLALAFGLGSLG